MAETVEVPFTQVGNLQVLTARQVAEMPWLGEFITRFKDCFEFDPQWDCYVFYGYDPHPSLSRNVTSERWTLLECDVSNMRTE